ncbi:MAG: peptide ABC transporter substrate-binding protein [Chlamydiales bacterium]
MKTQTLSLNLQLGDLPSLHPFHLQGPMRGYTVGKLVYEGLTRLNQNQKIELVGADQVIVSPCKKKYTFKLRPSSWSDGTEVTAFDYEKAWKWSLHPASDCPRAELLYVIKNAEEAKKGTLDLDQVGIKALDSYTLFIELQHPAPYFLELLSQPIFSPIHPKEVEKEPTIFNGPFLVDTWKKSDYLLLKANPNFWNNERRRLKAIHISMVRDSSTALQLFEKKELDWIGDHLSTIPNEALPDFQKKYHLQQRDTIRPFWIFLNTQHSILQSPSIRKALALSINQEQIAEHIFIIADPLKGPLHHSLSSLPFPPQKNSQDCKQLFREGLEQLDLTLSNIPELTISYFDQIPLKQLAEYLKEIWEDTFGLSIKLQGDEWNVFYSHLQRGTFHIGGCYITPYYNDPTEPLGRIAPNSPANHSQWVHSGYQEKLDIAQNTNSLEARKAALGEAEAILLDENPIIPVINRKVTFSHHPDLQGYTINYAGCVDFAFAYFGKTASSNLIVEEMK